LLFHCDAACTIQTISSMGTSSSRQQKQSTQCSVTQLCENELCCVLQYLETFELASCSVVCWTWRNALKTPMPWRGKTVKLVTRRYKSSLSQGYISVQWPPPQLLLPCKSVVLHNKCRGANKEIGIDTSSILVEDHEYHYEKQPWIIQFRGFISAGKFCQLSSLEIREYVPTTTFFEALQGATKLTSLTLANEDYYSRHSTSFSPDLGGASIEVLQNSFSKLLGAESPIRHLVLLGTMLPGIINGLCLALSTGHLVYLDYSAYQLGNEALMDLPDAISRNRTLKTLVLNENVIATKHCLLLF